MVKEAGHGTFGTPGDHLDKKQMLDGTVKRKLNIPVEHPQGKMVLETILKKILFVLSYIGAYR